jgi:glycosyltransferase involved in cell wall biosynthesis
MFHLARQMERLGHLGRLYTGYPRFKVENLPPEKVRTFPWLMSPYMMAGRIGLRAITRHLTYLVNTSFDDWVARNLEYSDIYHCMSGSGVRAHQTARERYGAVTVCDRASSHILSQQELIRQEFNSWGIAFSGTDRRGIDRELEEYESCDLIMVPSQFAYRTFVQNGVPPSKLRLHPFGVDLSIFHPVAPRDDTFRVLFVGQIGIRKGIPYLLEALAPLKLPHFELVLAGAILPEVRGILARYQGRFRHLGVIPHSKLPEVYSRASILVLPSIEEGLAYVQGEAMACGLPLIGTSNTGAEDLFTDGVEGFIVPIRDPAAIREKVLLLYNDPELREEMSRAALRRVKAIGGWDQPHIIRAVLSSSRRYSVSPHGPAGTLSTTSSTRPLSRGPREEFCAGWQDGHSAAKR